jgi:hypothetical protein
MDAKTKKLLYLVIRIVASAALLGFLLWKVDLKEFAGLLASAKPMPLVFAFLAWVCVLFLSNERWRKLLSAQRIEVPFLRLLVIYMISFFFNNFLPAALGMDISRTVYVAKEKGKASEVFASVLTERILGLLGLLIFALVALLFYLNTPEGKRFALLVVIITILLIAAAVLFLKRGFLPGFKKKLGSIKRFGLGERIRQFYQALQLYRQRIPHLAWAVFLSILVQGFLVVINYFAGVSLGLSIPLFSHLVFVPLISIIAMIPISINGIGVREWGYVFLFGTAGLSSGEALSLSLLFFAIGIAGSLMGGIAFLFKGK